MKIKVKKLDENAVIPSYAKPGDAGLDLTAISINKTSNYIEYGTGLSVEIPEGYVGLIFPRSSISNKTLTLTNSVGIIDSSYRGEIRFRFKHSDMNFSNREVYYEKRDRIGQLLILPYPLIELELTEELSKTKRNESGFGSSGN